MALPHELEVYVTQSDFERALQELAPSVSEEDMMHYERVQRQFKDVTMNAESLLGDHMDVAIATPVKSDGILDGHSYEVRDGKKDEGKGKSKGKSKPSE